MFVWLVLGGDQGILRVLEGKLTRLTQGVLTIWIEQIPDVMQEFVVGIPPIWRCLLRRVAKDILFFKEAEEVAVVDDAKDHA